MFMYSISTKLHAHASCYCDAFMNLLPTKPASPGVFPLETNKFLNGEWGVYLPCLVQSAVPLNDAARYGLWYTHRWRCHFDFILLAKMTLQRASRKRKSTEDSAENDLACAKILTEFQILQSLIPQIAGRIDITEVSFFRLYKRHLWRLFLISAWNYRCMCGLHWILAKPVKPKWNSLQVAKERELINDIYHQIVYTCQTWYHTEA